SWLVVLKLVRAGSRSPCLALVLHFLVQACLRAGLGRCAISLGSTPGTHAAVKSPRIPPSLPDQAGTHVVQQPVGRAERCQHRGKWRLLGRSGWNKSVRIGNRSEFELHLRGQLQSNEVTDPSSMPRSTWNLPIFFYKKLSHIGAKA